MKLLVYINISKISAESENSLAINDELETVSVFALSVIVISNNITGSRLDNNGFVTQYEALISLPLQCNIRKQRQTELPVQFTFDVTSCTTESAMILI